MDKVVIYGTGRHAELVAKEMKRYKLYDVVAFTVKNEYFNKTELNGLTVVPYEILSEIFPPSEFKLFIAIGAQFVNRTRETLFKEVKEKGYTFASYINPGAILPEDLVVGENVYIDISCGISEFVEIGDNVTIITSKIGHHCKIGDNSFISGSILAGNVKVEKNVFIGLGSSIGPNITLGHHTVIGVGCAITKNTDPESVYLNRASEKQSFNSSKLKLL